MRAIRARERTTFDAPGTQKYVCTAVLVEESFRMNFGMRLRRPDHDAMRTQSYSCGLHIVLANTSAL